MNTVAAALADPVRLGLVGAARIVALASIESVATATPVLVDKVDA